MSEFITGIQVVDDKVPTDDMWRRLKKADEEFQKTHPPLTTCSHCGYCPHCGRGGWYYRQFQPPLQPEYICGSGQLTQKDTCDTRFWE